MDVSCLVPGCSNRVKQNGISFHRLPIKDFTRLQKRLNNMKLKKSTYCSLKYCKLCSKHFTKDCNERDLRLQLLGIKKTSKIKE